MNDLAKMSTDIILFCTPEFGYFILPEKFCPGSSLMPQKLNPCPLELVRAKSATMQKTHLGETGNLDLELIIKRIKILREHPL
jgi:argininosuccinate lyase